MVKRIRFRRGRGADAVSRETTRAAVVWSDAITGAAAVAFHQVFDDLRRNPLLVRHVVEHKPRPKPFGGWVVMRWDDGQESRQRIDIGYGWRTSTIDIPRGIRIMHIEWDKATDG